MTRFSPSIFAGSSPTDLTNARVDHRLDTTKSNTSHEESDSDSGCKSELRSDRKPSEITSPVFVSPVSSSTTSLFPRKISESDFVSSFDRNKSPEIHSHAINCLSSPNSSSPLGHSAHEERTHSSPFDREDRLRSPDRRSIYESDREPGGQRKSPFEGKSDKHDSEKHSERSGDCESSTRLLLKEHTSPPNVTVVQPSVTHPMFPYFYHHGYPNSSSSLPYHMLLNQGSSSLAAHGLTYLPTTHGELNHLSPTHGLSAFGQLHMPGHPLYPNLSPTFSNNTTQSLSQMSGSHLGPLFASRSSNRFSPYSFPITKTTMATSTSSMTSSVFNVEPRSPTSPTPSSASLSSLNRSPPRSRSPIHVPSTANPNSELKSIERMLNGLERKREVGPDSTGAIVEK